MIKESKVKLNKRKLIIRGSELGVGLCYELLCVSVKVELYRYKEEMDRNHVNYLNKHTYTHNGLDQQKPTNEHNKNETSNHCQCQLFSIKN